MDSRAVTALARLELPFVHPFKVRADIAGRDTKKSGDYPRPKLTSCIKG
jgi:hypothetical protein